MSVEIAIADAARIIGVSRARVYQRVRDAAAMASRPLPAHTRASRARGNWGGKLWFLDIEDVLAWRAEREAAGLPVGPIPASIADHLVTAPPQIPPIVGMPNFSPF